MTGGRNGDEKEYTEQTRGELVRLAAGRSGIVDQEHRRPLFVYDRSD